MRTSRPIATISYNTPDFLNKVLEELARKRAISFWAWIEHYPEDDETKAHKHLYVEPNGQIDTDSLREQFLQVDLTNPTAKPLGTLNFRPSKFVDWYLYALHDSTYLETKGQSRRYHYTVDDIQTSDHDELVENIHMMDLSKINRAVILRDAAQNGVPFDELVALGQIPMQQVPAFRMAYESVVTWTNRNGREGHEQDDD